MESVFTWKWIDARNARLLSRHWFHYFCLKIDKKKLLLNFRTSKANVVVLHCPSCDFCQNLEILEVQSKFYGEPATVTPCLESISDVVFWFLADNLTWQPLNQTNSEMRASFFFETGWTIVFFRWICKKCHNWLNPC